MTAEDHVVRFTLTPAERSGPEIADGGRRVTIVGRREGCDAVLHSRSVSELHACLVCQDDGLWVHDLGSRNGTQVNRVAVRKHRLRDGDTVAFGKRKYAAHIQGGGGPELQAVAAAATDTVTGQVHRLSRRVTIVGRRGRSDLRIADDKVSRVHALLVRVPSGLVVHDVGSRTGVFVDGDRVAEALLTGGRKVTIGRTELLIDVEHAFGRTVTVTDPFASADEALTGMSRSDISRMDGFASGEIEPEADAAVPGIFRIPKEGLPREEPAETVNADDEVPPADAVDNEHWFDAASAEGGATPAQPGAGAAAPAAPADDWIDLSPEESPRPHGAGPPPPAAPWQGMLAVDPTSLRPARRPAAARESERDESEPAAQVAPPRDDSARDARQKRMADEVAALRRQLAAERQALTLQREMLQKQQEVSEERRRAAHEEAVQRLQVEREEVLHLRQQLDMMRESIQVERNALEVERRALSEAREALAHDTERLRTDRGRLAELTEELGVERGKLRKVQDEMAARQEELVAAHRRLDDQLAELARGGHHLTKQQEDLERQRRELTERERTLEQDCAEAEQHQRRLADMEGELHRRHGELTDAEQAVHRRAEELDEDLRQHEQRVAQFEQTAASASAASELASEAEHDIDAQAESESQAAEDPPATTESTDPPTAGESVDAPAEATPEAEPTPADAPEAAEKPDSVAPPAERPTAVMPIPEGPTGDASPPAEAETPNEPATEAAGEAVPWHGHLARESHGHLGRAAGSPATGATPMARTGKMPVPLKTGRNHPEPGAAPASTAPAARDIPAPPHEPPAPAAVAPRRRKSSTGWLLCVLLLVVLSGAAIVLAPILFNRSGAPVATREDEAAGPAQPASPPDVSRPNPPTLPATETTATEPPAAPVTDTRQEPTVPEVATLPIPPKPDEPPQADPPVAEPPTADEPPAPEPAAPVIPGGIWPYKAPENLVPGPPAADLKATLDWARRDLAPLIDSLRRAYGMADSAGPTRAIAIERSEGLIGSLNKYLPPPYLAQQTVDADGRPTDEHVRTLVFLEFLHNGRPYLFVLKRREGDGSVVAGRQGSFVLVPGAVQEHTVVLDPTRKAAPEPVNP